MDGRRVEASFTSRETSVEAPGISLVHMADRDIATTGDLIVFSAWVLNPTTETLLDISLTVRSFTNSHLDPLQYKSQPSERMLKGRVLGPRQALQYSFSYVLNSRDTEESGELISALCVEATSESLGVLYSECDSIIATRR